MENCKVRTNCWPESEWVKVWKSAARRELAFEIGKVIEIQSPAEETGPDFRPSELSQLSTAETVAADGLVKDSTCNNVNFV